MAWIEVYSGQRSLAFELTTAILCISNQPRPQGFSLKWVGRPHPFFKGKALGTRLIGNT